VVLLVSLLRLVKGVVIAADDLLPVQCRMARAALGWSVDQLAAAAGVDRKTILRFEQRSTVPRAANVAAMRQALEQAGVRFAEPAGVFAPASSG
jgi:transcriptional regulator with XRE-family HTH domain